MASPGRIYVWIADHAANWAWTHHPLIVTVHVKVMRALLRRRLTRFRVGTEYVVPYLEGRLVLNPEDIAITWGILDRGVWSADHVSVLRTLIRPGDQVVDVGANIGTHAVVMARAAGENGRVVALEPEPENAALLRRNVAVNRLSNVHVEQTAAVESPGTIDLLLAMGNKGAHSTRVQGLGATAAAGRIKVQADTLDNIIHRLRVKRLRLVKIDVQGGEGAVLRGAHQALGHAHPWLLLEYSPVLTGSKRGELDDEIGWLCELGYEFAILRPGPRIEVTTRDRLRAIREEVDLLGRPPAQAWPSIWEQTA